MFDIYKKKKKNTPMQIHKEESIKKIIKRLTILTYLCYWTNGKQRLNQKHI